MILGVVSDTHGLVRPSLLEALAGVDRILHAGDIGGPYVLEALQTVAPVIAIRGNNDLPAAVARLRRRDKPHPDWAAALPDRRWLQLAGLTLLLEHEPEHVAAADLERADGVIVGHTHRPRFDPHTWWLNPGSAGPRRFHLPVRAARLTLPAITVSWIEPM